MASIVFVYVHARNALRVKCTNYVHVLGEKRDTYVHITRRRAWLCKDALPLAYLAER